MDLTIKPITIQTEAAPTVACKPFYYVLKNSVDCERDAWQVVSRHETYKEAEDQIISHFAFSSIMGHRYKIDTIYEDDWDLIEIRRENLGL